MRSRRHVTDEDVHRASNKQTAAFTTGQEEEEQEEKEEVGVKVADGQAEASEGKETKQEPQSAQEVEEILVVEVEKEEVVLFL